jgi:hypothetical protein
MREALEVIQAAAADDANAMFRHAAVYSSVRRESRVGNEGSVIRDKSSDEMIWMGVQRLLEAI